MMLQSTAALENYSQRVVALRPIPIAQRNNTRINGIPMQTDDDDCVLNICMQKIEMRVTRRHTKLKVEFRHPKCLHGDTTRVLTRSHTSHTAPVAQE